MKSIHFVDADSTHFCKATDLKGFDTRMMSAAVRTPIRDSLCSMCRKRLAEVVARQAEESP